MRLRLKIKGLTSRHKATRERSIYGERPRLFILAALFRSGSAEHLSKTVFIYSKRRNTEPVKLILCNLTSLYPNPDFHWSSQPSYSAGWKGISHAAVSTKMPYVQVAQ